VRDDVRDYVLEHLRDEDVEDVPHQRPPRRRPRWAWPPAMETTSAATSQVQITTPLRDAGGNIWRCRWSAASHVPLH